MVDKFASPLYPEVREVDKATALFMVLCRCATILREIGGIIPIDTDDLSGEVQHSLCCVAVGRIADANV